MTSILSLPVADATAVVALTGNPNTGKSTLFNALTGIRQRVANYPGVTVDKKVGLLRGPEDGRAVEVIDLPGTYSLSANSADEAIVLEVLLGRVEPRVVPDVIVVVVDATNLARNLFLVSQVLEIGRPVVVALNMMDLAERAGLRLDVTTLAHELGCAVVPVVAIRPRGLEELRHQIVAALSVPASTRCPSFPECICAELDGLGTTVSGSTTAGHSCPSRVELLQTLLGPGGYHESRLIQRCGRGLADELSHRRERIRAAGESIVQVEARIRYAWIDRVVAQVVHQEGAVTASTSERIDRFLTHRFWGLLILLSAMGFCFQAIYSWAGPVMGAIDSTFGTLGGYLGSVMPPGALRSLVVDGVVAGVGAVLVFLPQILVLFLFLAILEDCGYMARAAFLLDRWMGLLGLSGKSFIPLLSSFACAVPGIMATRTIEHRRDRFLTILIAPLMSCSARLPVYVLLIGAFIPATSLLGGMVNLQAVVLMALYLLGVVTAIGAAVVLKHTFLRGAPQSFLMELPVYRWPHARTVLFRMYEQGREFCLSAGTLIFAVAIVIWAAGYFPRPAVIAESHEALRAQARLDLIDASTLGLRLDEIDRLESGAYLRQSLLGRLGHWIEPAVRPLGWDWRIGTAVIASFPAREVVIATMGTIYHLGEGESGSEGRALPEKLKTITWPDGRPVYNTAVALSLMVFFALCCQCGATLATIRRETKSWGWPALTFTYMTALAYAGAWVTYQLATRWSSG